MPDDVPGPDFTRAAQEETDRHHGKPTSTQFEGDEVAGGRPPQCTEGFKMRSAGVELYRQMIRGQLDRACDPRLSQFIPIVGVGKKADEPLRHRFEHPMGHRSPCRSNKWKA